MKHIDCFTWIGIAGTAFILVAMHVCILEHGGWIAAWLYWSVITGLGLGQVLRSRKY